MSIIQSYRDEVKKLNAQNAALRKQRDELLALLIETTINEWQPGFIAREYNSDEPQENEFRERVLSIIDNVKGSK